MLIAFALSYCTSPFSSIPGLSGYLLVASIGFVDEGLFYPNCSYQTLKLYLYNRIKKNNKQNSIYKELKIKSILLSEIAKPDNNHNLLSNIWSSQKMCRKFNATGVSCISDSVEVQLFASKSVISGLGTLNTFLNLLPHSNILSNDNLRSILCENTIADLSNLREVAPSVKIVFWLTGDLKFTIPSCEYLEMQFDSINTTSKRVIKVWSPTAKLYSSRYQI